MTMLGVAIPSFASLIYLERLSLQKLKPIGGYANMVTLLRLTGLFVLLTFSGFLSNTQIAVALFILIILDGTDGFLARRFSHETLVGEIFDMETDALYVCFISILLFEKGLTGMWILFVGFMRYYYVILIFTAGLQRLKEKRTKYGPFIGVILFVSLMMPFVFNKEIYVPCLYIASILVTFSFGWSFYLLLKERYFVSDFNA